MVKSLTITKIARILRERQMEILEELKEYARIGMLDRDRLKQDFGILHEIDLLWIRLNKY